MSFLLLDTAGGHRYGCGGGNACLCQLVKYRFECKSDLGMNSHADFTTGLLSDRNANGCFRCETDTEI